MTRPPAPKITREQIANLRQSMQLSQAVFAKALNATLSTVSSWEQGVRVPSGPALRLLEIAAEHPHLISDRIRSRVEVFNMSGINELARQVHEQAKVVADFVRPLKEMQDSIANSPAAVAQRGLTRMTHETLEPMRAAQEFAKEVAGASAMMQSFRLPEIPRIPFIAPLPLPIREQEDLASDHCQRLVARIHAFEAGLDEESEVGLCLVNFAPDFILHLSGIGYSNPSLLIFSGIGPDGSPVQLMQHVSQISVLLQRVKKVGTRPIRVCGFAADDS